MKRIFFDMDGTLNVWELGTGLDKVSAPGYMRNRTPISSMIGAAQALSEKYEIWTASAVLDFSHAIPDKDIWMDRYMAFVPKFHRVYMPYGTNKAATLERYIRNGDAFIDDYTPNLRDVSIIDGSVCIKCINGINDTHHSWLGARVSIFSKPDVIARTIDGLMESSL